jgi:hypothetical protein
MFLADWSFAHVPIKAIAEGTATRQQPGGVITNQVFCPRASRVGTGRIWTYLVPGRTGVPGRVRAGGPRHPEVLSGWARSPSRVNWRVRRQPSSPAGRSRTR